LIEQVAAAADLEKRKAEAAMCGFGIVATTRVNIAASNGVKFSPAAAFKAVLNPKAQQ
jgi:nucleoid DNA-binding protein